MPTATSHEPIHRRRWWMPAISVAIGLAMLGAYWIGDDLGAGLGALGVMTAVGALFFFGTGSETLQGLAGPGRDERWAMIDLRATTFAGMTAITFALGAFLYEIARGEDGSPYGILCTVAGVAYILAIGVLRLRS
jgi:hypothetical protein